MIKTERFPWTLGPSVSHAIDLPTVIAIPARNERERIVACLNAVALSLHRPLPTIVLLANNTIDATGAVACDAARHLGLTLHLREVELPPERASAGQARRLAMEHAAVLAPDDAVLITTDADGRVEPGWLDANLRAIEAGADAVCGMAIIDPDEALAIPQALHDDDAREVFYATLLDELDSLIDPDPADPWPRHAEESGASIAVRRSAYERAGGIPPLRSGEDRAFLDALRRIDARIRHAPEARVIVSGRLEGRAVGGMADTIRRRMTVQDQMLDDRLEPVADAIHRAETRSRLRRASPEGFGRLWHAYEASDARLSIRRPIQRSLVEDEIALAKTLRNAFQRRLPSTGSGKEPRPLTPQANPAET